MSVALKNAVFSKNLLALVLIMKQIIKNILSFHGILDSALQDTISHLKKTYKNTCNF